MEVHFNEELCKLLNILSQIAFSTSNKLRLKFKLKIVSNSLNCSSFAVSGAYLSSQLRLVLTTSKQQRLWNDVKHSNNRPKEKKKKKISNLPDLHFLPPWTYVSNQIISPALPTGQKSACSSLTNPIHTLIGQIFKHQINRDLLIAQ